MPPRNASYLPQRSLLLDPQRNSLLARREGAPDTLSLLKNTGQWMRENPMDALAIGAAPIPIAGDVIGVANDLRHLAQNPSWGNLGWTALGALPFVPSGLGAIRRQQRKGPQLTRQEFEDVFFSRSKDRSKWGEKRKAEWKNLKEKILDTQRQRGVEAPTTVGLYQAPPSLREGPVAFEDPLIKKSRMRQFELDRLREVRSYTNLGEGLWSETFLKEVARNPSPGAVTRANMEAVPRALKKEGWTLRHSSKGYGSRASSRYIVSPDGSYEVRLTDHYLPETQERLHRMEQGQGSSWNDEIVLNGSETPNEIIQSIKAGFKDR